MTGRDPGRQGPPVDDIGTGDRDGNIRKPDRQRPCALGDVAQQAGEAGALFDRFDGGGGEIAPGRGADLMPFPVTAGVGMATVRILVPAQAAGFRLLNTVGMVRGGDDQPRHGGEQEAGDDELAGAAPHG